MSVRSRVLSPSSRSATCRSFWRIPVSQPPTLRLPRPLPRPFSRSCSGSSAVPTCEGCCWASPSHSLSAPSCRRCCFCRPRAAQCCFTGGGARGRIGSRSGCSAHGPARWPRFGAFFVTVWAVYGCNSDPFYGIATLARGVMELAEFADGGDPSFLLGHINLHGSPAFFPVLILVKSPLPFLAAVAIGAAVLLRSHRRDWRRMAPLVGAVAIVASVIPVADQHRIAAHPAGVSAARDRRGDRARADARRAVTVGARRNGRRWGRAAAGVAGRRNGCRRARLSCAISTSSLSANRSES